MKTRIATLLTSLALAASALAHGDVELGPNGGRLVEFGDHTDIHAEVALKDGKFVIGLYDEKAKKEIPVTDQKLTITHKEANKKLTPELKDGKWALAKPEGDDFWLIMQLKDNDKAKARNGRLHYDATKCSACNNPEWLCKCAEKEEKK
ncbi:hypothetical protein ACXR0O_16205 [Verrucomicrobiota bacterium sgz303538]